MEATLVSRLQRKDHAAYDELIARYGDVLYGYIFQSTHDRRQSEALLSATFFRVVEQIDRYTSANPPFIVWLYRIAHTVTRDTLPATPCTGRARQRTVAGSTLPSPAAHMLSFKFGQVHEGFDTLSLEEQQVIMLRCVADMSLNEVGYVLGMSNRAVKQLQFQALRALQEQLM